MQHQAQCAQHAPDNDQRHREKHPDGRVCPGTLTKLCPAGIRGRYSCRKDGRLFCRQAPLPAAPAALHSRSRSTARRCPSTASGKCRLIKSRREHSFTPNLRANDRRLPDVVPYRRTASPYLAMLPPDTIRPFIVLTIPCRAYNSGSCSLRYCLKQSACRPNSVATRAVGSHSLSAGGWPRHYLEAVAGISFIGSVHYRTSVLRYAFTFVSVPRPADHPAPNSAAPSLSRKRTSSPPHRPIPISAATTETIRWPVVSVTSTVSLSDGGPS